MACTAWLGSGDAAGALAAYEATLVREPRRARSLYGAGRAAEQVGDRDAAARYAGQLLELMDRADPARPEPAWARGIAGTTLCGANCPSS